MKGGIEETSMGQYFRKWLDQEGLIPENSIPEADEVRFNAHDCTVLGTLSALGAKLDALPESIEQKMPIGVKLMFERLVDQEGQAWYRASMVYRSTEQIRSGEMLTPENPPMKYVLSFENDKATDEGLISEADFFALFNRTIEASDELEESYALPEAA